jgi:hypothetical protein
MFRAQLEIILRNGNVINVGFDDDEVVNSVVERLKKTIADINGLFPLEITNNGVVPPTTVHHYLPSREIVRFAVVQFPRVATPT